VDTSGPWQVLPPGIHDAAMEEIKQHFATNPVSTLLYHGFVQGAGALKYAGCTTIYLNGSFVSDKPNPADYDACWEPSGVDPGKLDMVFLDFGDSRRRQKAKFGGEFFPSAAQASTVTT